VLPVASLFRSVKNTICMVHTLHILQTVRPAFESLQQSGLITGVPKGQVVFLLPL
jgi:hypothetical protein